MPASARRIAVLSDIHGNADALRVALDAAQAAAPDLTVILGDLLTYGAQPLEVLDLLDGFAASAHSQAFISGNHDEFYFRLQAGAEALPYRLAPFVEESVLWTRDRIAAQPALAGRYPWRHRHVDGPVLFSHANPYEYGDWSYVANDEACRKAAQTLRAGGHRLGVFGHSHRAFAAKVAPGGVVPLPQRSWQEIGAEETVIINPGAVGQPRGTGLSYLILDLDGPRIRADIRPIEIDLTAQRRAIAAAALTAQTKDRLLSYLEG